MSAIASLEPQLASALTALAIASDSERVGRWLGYLDLLARWNQTYNLTAIRDPAEMLTRHLLDSLAMAPYWTEPEIADMGSGAGLPGIALAILHPERRVWLIESNGKKARFLREVKRQLGLDQVEVIEGRAEAFRPDAAIGCATARALAPLERLCAWCRPWLGADGRLLAMKGPGYQEELPALPADFALATVETLRVPGLDAERVLLILQRLPAPPARI